MTDVKERVTQADRNAAGAWWRRRYPANAIIGDEMERGERDEHPTIGFIADRGVNGMAAALERMVAAYTGDWINCEEAIAQARAALAKYRGEA